MKRQTLSIFVWLLMLYPATSILSLSTTTAHAQAIRLKLSRIDSGQLDLELNSTSKSWHRIDTSTDLTTWTLVDILPDTNTLKHLPIQTSPAVRFFRASQVDPKLTILNVNPQRANPGDIVTIDGLFFETRNPDDNEVTVGGVQTELISATATRLTVRIPTQAHTGHLRVTTPSASTQSQDPIVVAHTLPVDILDRSGHPLPGFIPFTFASVGTNGTLAIRENAPAYAFAVNDNTNSPAGLLTVASPTDTRIVFDPAHMAAALVFLHPQFATFDPILTSESLTLLRTNTAVRQVADLLASQWPPSPNFLTNASLLNAVSNAVLSAATSSAAFSIANAWRDSLQKPFHTEAAPDPFTIDAEYVILTDQTDDFTPLPNNKRRFSWSIGPRFPWVNPVDWQVVVTQIDADLAFPEGRTDFFQTVRTKDVLHNFPTKGEPIATSSVEAKLVTDAANLLKRAFKSLIAQPIKDAILPPDDTVTFPGPDALYLARVVGPAVGPNDEAVFTLEQLPTYRYRAYIQNLVNGAMDLVGVFIDSNTIDFNENFKKELIAKTSVEAAKKVPNLKTLDDVKGAIADLAGFVLSELVDKLREVAAHALAKQAAQEAASNLTKKAASFAKELNGVVKAIEIGAGIGMVAQRSAGFFTTTALETSFVMVGNPFQLQILSVEPATAAPGDILAVHYKTSPSVPPFNPANPRDLASFVGTSEFFAEVPTPGTRTTDGIHSLTVQVPKDLPVSAQGTYNLVLSSHGRRGEFPLTLNTQPILTSFDPLQGYPQTQDFLGSPFPGTTVTLQGFNLYPTNQFFFSGPNSTFIETTNKSAGTGGRIKLQVPPGAITGPIRIRATDREGKSTELLSSPFTIPGPPKILDASPRAGTQQSSVALTVTNILSDTSTARVLYNGTPLTAVTLPAANRPFRLILAIPASATSGAIEVVTPTGRDSIPFTVLPGLRPGGTIRIGTNSIISLARACEIADGRGALIDDDIDSFYDPATGKIFNYDEHGAVEEGDFITDNIHTDQQPRFPVGPGFITSIQLEGTLAGSGEIHGTNIHLGGGVKLTGDLVIHGNDNVISIPAIQGTLTILGDNNLVDSVRFTNSPGTAIIIRGNYNQVRSCHFQTNFGDGIRIEGGLNNTVGCNSSSGNTGNGVTVTGGATGTTVRISSGYDPVTRSIRPGAGNRGHGVAIVGEAYNTTIISLVPGFGGNDLDGVHIEGDLIADTVLNSFETTANGRHGLYLGPGSRRTSVGAPVFDAGIATVIPLSSNGGSGLVVTGDATFSAGVKSTGNRGSGVLATDLHGNTNLTRLYAYTQGNREAGVKLDKATTGLLLSTGRPSIIDESIGLLLDGPDVTGNLINASVSTASGPGVLLQQARSNTLTLWVTSGKTNGIVLSGASNNQLLVNSCANNAGTGILLTENSQGNFVTSATATPFLDYATGNLDGITLENGANNNRIHRLSVSTNKRNGITLRGIGTATNQLSAVTLNGNAADGVLVTEGASDNNIGMLSGGGLQNPNASFPQENKGSGVRISGRGTDNNSIRNCTFGYSSKEPAGVIVENQAAGTTIENSTFFSTPDAIRITSGADHTTIRANNFTSLTSSAISISDATATIVGGAVLADQNMFQNLPLAISLSGPETRNSVVQGNVFRTCTNDAILVSQGAHDNQIGPNNDIQQCAGAIRLRAASTNRLTGNLIAGNANPGINLQEGATRNFISGNTLRNNSAGIRTDGPQTSQNAFRKNSIHSHAGPGILIGPDSQNRIQPPALLDLDNQTLRGTVNAPDGSQIEVFRDKNDEGETYLGTTTVAARHFQLDLDLSTLQLAATATHLNATVTDPDGNTSAFGPMDDLATAPTRIAFLSTRTGGPEVFTTLLTRNTDGSPTPTTQLTATAGHAAQPRISADGTLVLYASDESGNWELYLRTTSTSGTPKRLTSHPAADQDPAWGPNQSEIWFTSDRTSEPHLYRMNLDGTQVAQLNVPLPARWPTPSPDGKRLACSIRTSQGQWQLAVANTDGSQFLILPNQEGDNLTPAWSPDGSRIAFVSTRTGARKIFTCAPDGTSLLQITQGPADDLTPAWTGTTGPHIVYASNRAGDATTRAFELYATSPQGSSPVRLTFSGGDNLEPSASR